MKNFKFLIVAAIAFVAISSCKKSPVNLYDGDAHLAADNTIIQKYLVDNNLTAEFTKDQSGVYYKIIQPGTDDVVFRAASQITCNYTAKVLGNSKVIDSTGVFDTDSLKFQNATPATFTFGQLISGFQIGLSLTGLKKGGKIRVIIPSPYAYQDYSPSTNVPANSILDYTIELIDVNNDSL